MKSIILALTMVISASVFAETQTFEVKGMSCSNCVKKVVSKVCANGTFAKCDVQVGQITVETKPGQKIDVAQLKKDVSSAGDEYEKYDLGEPIAAAPTKTKK